MPSPEKVAADRFNSKCAVVCTEFYNNKPEKSLTNACDIINNGLFGSANPVVCTVKEGQDKFPTSDVYLREALLTGKNLVVDPQRIPFYKSILGQKFKEFDQRTDVERKKGWRPLTYQKFRSDLQKPEALLTFIQVQDPEFTWEDLKEFTEDVCRLSEYQDAKKSRKRLMLTTELRDRGYATEDTDARKMATDIMELFKSCS